MQPVALIVAPSIAVATVALVILVVVVRRTLLVTLVLAFATLFARLYGSAAHDGHLTGDRILLRF